MAENVAQEASTTDGSSQVIHQIQSSTKERQTDINPPGGRSEAKQKDDAGQVDDKSQMEGRKQEERGEEITQTRDHNLEDYRKQEEIGRKHEEEQKQSGEEKQDEEERRRKEHLEEKRKQEEERKGQREEGLQFSGEAPQTQSQEEEDAINQIRRRVESATHQAQPIDSTHTDDAVQNIMEGAPHHEVDQTEELARRRLTQERRDKRSEEFSKGISSLFKVAMLQTESQLRNALSSQDLLLDRVTRFSRELEQLGPFLKLPIFQEKAARLADLKTRLFTVNLVLGHTLERLDRIVIYVSTEKKKIQQRANSKSSSISSFLPIASIERGIERALGKSTKEQTYPPPPQPSQYVSASFATPALAPTLVQYPQSSAPLLASAKQAPSGLPQKTDAPPQPSPE